MAAMLVTFPSIETFSLNGFTEHVQSMQKKCTKRSQSMHGAGTEGALSIQREHMERARSVHIACRERVGSKHSPQLIVGVG